MPCEAPRRASAASRARRCWRGSPRSTANCSTRRAAAAERGCCASLETRRTPSWRHFARACPPTSTHGRVTPASIACCVTGSACRSSPTMLEPGAILTLDVEKAAAGGRMLARHHGQVVLVWGAIPGERVDARVERVGKGVVYASTAAVLSASSDRRNADADWRCGGSVLAHVEYPRQLTLKGQIVEDAFRRIARLPLPPPDVIGSPEAGYRMRARLHA